MSHTDPAAVTHDDSYCQVWQTWTLHTPQRTQTTETDEPSLAPVNDRKRFRGDLQRARIQKRMSIPELGNAVKCDAGTLSAYEMGQAVLDAGSEARLARFLAIEPPH